MTTSAFTVAFAPERAQYCVERADGLRIWPTPFFYSDPDARKRAGKLADALNRMEAERAPTSACGCDAPDHALRATQLHRDNGNTTRYWTCLACGVTWSDEVLAQSGAELAGEGEV